MNPEKGELGLGMAERQFRLRLSWEHQVDDDLCLTTINTFTTYTNLRIPGLRLTRIPNRTVTVIPNIVSFSLPSIALR